MMAVGESTPRIGPGPVNNWLFERKLGGSGAPKTPQEALEERSRPMAPPVYNPDVAPRPDATARSAAPARSAGSMPAAISGSTKADPSMGPPGAIGAVTDGPAAYHNTEMGGSKWSDNYSFLGGAEFSSDKGYDPISRNFESLIPTGASASTYKPPAPKRTAKEDELLQQFERYTASRDKDIPGPVGRR